MYSETWKFYSVVYSLMILWCCMISTNGDTDINDDQIVITKTDSTSDLLKILLGNPNETRVDPLNSILLTNSSVGSINFNILSTYSGSNIPDTQRKKPINKVRHDYSLTEGIGYHKLHMRKLSWYNALQACIDENAHLAVINSAEEEATLRQLLKNSEIADDAFIGAHDMFKEGLWVTINGETLVKAGFNQWHNLGFVAPAHENYDCAVLRVVGGMDDMICDNERYYICEI